MALTWLYGLLPFRSPASPRKLRLFTCACCRRNLLPDQANRDLVVAVEDYPHAPSRDARGIDGWSQIYPELDAALSASSRREHEWGENPFYWAVKYLGRSYYKYTPLSSALAVGGKIVRAFDGVRMAAEQDAQAHLVRDIFVQPNQSLSLDPAWLQYREGVVHKLAQAIYEDRAFDRMPILGDALEEAGCNNPDLLSHCRCPGPHVRGCWVVDLLLGKD